MTFSTPGKTSRGVTLSISSGPITPMIVRSTPRERCGVHPAVSTSLLGPRTEAQLEDLLATVEVTLDEATLDRIDEVNPPGVLINPNDQDWSSPDLEPSARRR